MLSTLLNRPCTITRRSFGDEVDERGDYIATESAVETVCELQQKQRSEPEDQGELSDTTWLLILPAGTAIDTGDAVTMTDTGEEFEMVGDPWPARNPRTRAESHVEATVRRTAGDLDGDAS